ncbi:MAG: hypothetical protein WCF24_09830 [Acidimicrobiales bacterium]
MRMRRLSTNALVPFLGLILMAFGSRAVLAHGESAKQLVQAAARAVASAKSIRLSGSVPVSGGTEIIDFVMFSNGDLEGSLTLMGDLVHITIVNGTDYYQAPPTYWQKVGGLPATLAKQIAPDWISTPTSSSAGTGDSFQIAPLASQIDSTTTGLTIVGHKKVDGHAAVGVRSSNGSVLWIATTGTPYPISEVQQGKSGNLSFSGWNSFRSPTAPKGAIPLSSLRS